MWMPVRLLLLFALEFNGVAEAAFAETMFTEFQNKALAIRDELPSEASLKQAERQRLMSARFDALQLRNSIEQMPIGLARYWKYFVSLKPVTPPN